MAKKPVISKEAQVLLKLLRMALGTEVCGDSGEGVGALAEGIDWREVVRLSYEHKVSALAVDGLLASGYDTCKGLDEKRAEEMRAVLEPWIKDVENSEWSYCYYVEVLMTLCEIFRENGLTPIILKGYGLSLNYPRPNHRRAGDIDLFLLNKNGKPAGEVADEIVRKELNLEVEELDQDGHSHFDFKGITIEIHHNLFTPKSETEQSFHNFLIEELCKDSRPMNGYESVCLPSPIFNALFLIRHIAKHFGWIQLDYRQLVDWSLFINRYYNEIDWKIVQNELSQVGLIRLFGAINGAAVKYLSLNAQVPNMTNSVDADYVMLPLWHNGTGLSNFAFYYMNRSRNSLLGNEHWLALTLRSIKKRLL